MTSLDDALLALHPDALIATDIEGRILRWNEGAVAIFGFTAGEAVGQLLDEVIVPPEKMIEHHALLDQLRREGNAHSETVRRCKDGSLIHVDARARHAVLAGERYVLWAKRDVTQPKVLREASRLQAQFGELLDSIPDAMLAVDETGHILLANSHAEHVFGYEHGDLRGRSAEDLVPERFRAQRLFHHRLGYFGNPRARAISSDPQLYGLRRDGDEFPVEISLRPVQSAAGLLVMSAVRDTTERQRAEQKFRGLLEAAPDAIVIVDPSGKIVLANSSADLLFGYVRNDLIGQHVEMLLPDRFRPAHAEHREGFFAHPRVRSMGAGLELYARRRDGSEFPVEVSLSPLETEDGTLVSAAVRDITERKRVEKQLQEQNLQLVNANQAKSQFLASMSHELRTPLNAIIGFTGTLLMELPGPLNEEQFKQLSTVQQAGQHLLALINDLLDLTRIEAGRNDITLVPVNGSELAGSAVEELRPLAAGKGLDLTFEAPSEPLVVMADRRILLQILLNLLGNALKYTDTGTIRMQLARLDVDGVSYVAFRVIDTGIGIAPEDHHRLFKAFSQVGQPLRATEGAGLGLYLCARLTEMLGGRIEFSSKVGVGSVFSLHLPAA